MRRSNLISRCPSSSANDDRHPSAAITAGVSIQTVTTSEVSHQELRGTARYSLVVLAYVGGAYWVTQQLLAEWISSADLNFFLIQPVIWLGLALASYVGWSRLPGAPAISRQWLVTAALIGVVYVGVIVFAGIVGGMTTVRPGVDWLVYLENTWYVGTLAVGVETARTYLFHAWKTRWPSWVWPMVVILFFVVTTPYAQFQALDTVDRAVEIIGSSLVPALGLGILATWFADRGGMGASLAFRAPILAWLWYSLVLPDLHWSTTLAVGVAAAVVAYAFAGPVAKALTEPEPAP